MTTDSQTCPKCTSPYGYSDGTLWVCPECFHEWSLDALADEASAKFLDANGNQLQDGDSVTVIRDLKAGKSTIKSGTKVKNIRLLEEPVNDHDISCKIDGHGSMYLKCSVVKKA
ncbi:alkylphosphonate utilization protein [Halobacteriovorax marinus]|uniref:Phosphonoacetate hydrolase n=1 Tax=Halobacteriovorax marinus (strain ATCC BAA-682 / DSM 15412 / SJ) TaxID=862908 RepID=E1WX44_HALMS|nr:zinc ribbon domain-containing protein YjdM [Halobacteriovorax marinus]ATH07135.1 alkylphosphonate utilization protein [Halobacteriovorax marinus]CBW25745.1 putative phosphonoacetate hydrolase [Halobacteriovorax marinus SJ]